MRQVAEIKELLAKADGEKELSAFILEFSEDERSGVQKLVQTAKKRRDAYFAEVERTRKMQEYERANSEYGLLCGIDEVGRGPLAGPVYAAAVILPTDSDILYLNDSKKLSEKKREELYDVIMEKAVAVGIGSSTCERIDEINILQATFEAMTKAAEKGLIVSCHSEDMTLGPMAKPFRQEALEIMKGVGLSAWGPGDDDFDEDDEGNAEALDRIDLALTKANDILAAVKLNELVILPPWSL